MARARKNIPDAVRNAPPLDFSSLVTTVEEVEPASGAGRFTDNPFIDPLRDSYKTDQDGGNGWRGLRVMGTQVRELVAALRNAAQQLANEEIGIRLKYAFVTDDDRDEETGDLKMVPEDEREVLVKFCGRPRRVTLTDAQRAEAFEHGFTLGEGDSQRIDVRRYFAWTAQREQDAADDAEEYNGE